ncbi:MAG: sugar phosphate isomerase/epimerase [Alicyclobacillus sp.]|nr:sugar phosphate isomerase/epimerase [Alicyclobacillus sp.]
MKWSVCTTGMKEWPLERVLDTLMHWRAEGCALAGLELWAGHIDDYLQRHPGGLSELAARLRACAVEVPVISAYTYFSKGQAERTQDLQELRRLAQFAEALGAQAIRTFFGHLPSHRANPELWDESLTALQQALTQLQPTGVQLWVETHYNTFADNPDAIAELMRGTAHTGLRLIYDAANFNADRIDPLAALQQLYPWVRHIHVKNYRWDHDHWYRSQPVSVFDPNGDVDNAAVLRELAQRGYDGFISLEYFGQRGWSALLQSLAECRARSA